MREANGTADVGLGLRADDELRLPVPVDGGLGPESFETDFVLLVVGGENLAFEALAELVLVDGLALVVVVVVSGHGLNCYLVD